MVDVEELAEAFPEVEIETLGTIHERIGDPDLKTVAETLEAAAERGKVPDSDYLSRVSGATEPRLHPGFKEELEREGLDPERAEEGLKAEQRALQQNWEEKAKRAAKSGSVEEVIGLYVDLQKTINQVLQSPTRSDIPEDMEIASSILSNEVGKHVSRIGESGNAERIRTLRKQIQRIPAEEVREAYLETIRGWLTLAENDGTEAAEARQWVLEPDDPEEVAGRLERLKSGSEFDVTTEQLLSIGEDVRARFTPD